MTKYLDRIKARSMRKKGISIVFIAQQLGVSKSSVSLWCRDIILSDEQFEKLRKNMGVSFKYGQRIAAQVNRQKKLDVIKKADIWGRNIINKISQRELLLIATALYWSEGSKTDSTSTLMFINSDPDMILLMKKFLIRVMGVKLEDIVCGIQINRVHEIRIKKVLNFWKNLLKLKYSQIRKPYFVNTKTSKTYENYNDYYGVCRLFVRKSKHLKYKMLALIEAVKSNILPT